MSSEGFFNPRKKRCDMFSESNAANPALCRQLRYLAHFKFEKSAPNRYYYLQQVVIPYQITQQNSLQRAGGPKEQ
jgi:hypothetical protein